MLSPRHLRPPTSLHPDSTLPGTRRRWRTAQMKYEWCTENMYFAPMSDMVGKRLVICWMQFYVIVGKMLDQALVMTNIAMEHYPFTSDLCIKGRLSKAILQISLNYQGVAFRVPNSGLQSGHLNVAATNLGWNHVGTHHVVS